MVHPPLAHCPVTARSRTLTLAHLLTSSSCPNAKTLETQVDTTNPHIDTDSNPVVTYNQWKIPVIAHNSKGYDSHFLIKALAHFTDDLNKGISCIPTNTEKFLMIAFKGMKFIDSASFMLESLAKLGTTLKESCVTPEQEAVGFKQCIKAFKKLGPNYKKMLSKQLYPYEYITSVAKLLESCLPPIEDFYSTLTDEDITEEQYKWAQEIWTLCGCKTLSDYHIAYLTVDVALLSDVIENFRNKGFMDKGLDPLNYLSLPGYSMDALLKQRMNKGKKAITLFEDTQQEMYTQCERNIRGGICHIARRHAKANHKYLPNYNDKEDSRYIMYLDANNLYGWAMSQLLPTGDFKYDAILPLPKEIARIKTLDPKGPRGFFYRVDGTFPQDKHNLLNDYAPAPVNAATAHEKLSQIQHMMYNDTAVHKKDGEMAKPTKPTPKLLCSLENRVDYMCHYRNLQLYMTLGFVVTKVYEIISFTQEAWMADYVQTNTTARSKTNNKFLKDFYKLLVNSIFGKTLESVRKRINYELVCNIKKFHKLCADPKFKGRKIITDQFMGADGIMNMGLVGVERYQTSVTLDKPISTGFSVLELSKLLMYDFHYNTMVKKYGDKVKLLFTDTDSLCYVVETEDFYKDMMDNETKYHGVCNEGGATMKEQFDNSDYPKDHPCYDESNKKTVGKFKDEASGMPITEFVGLRAKMYSYTTHDKDSKPITDEEVEAAKKASEHTKAKGIPKAIAKKIRHQEYLECVLRIGQSNPAPYVQHKVNVTSFRSFNQEMFTLNMTKSGLSPFDDKRFILDDGVSTRAHGHYLNFVMRG